MPHVSPQPSRPVRVLFVCLGNICRSPSAEGLFRHYVASQGAEGDYEIDSAGLIAHHEGELPDPYYGGAEGFEHVLDLLEICLPDLYEKTRPTA